MKGILFTVSILVFWVVKAQVNVDTIPGTKTLNKGFYKNYDEFIANSPSIVTEFRLTKQILNKTDSTIISTDFVTLTKTKGLKNIWGFCDGKNVFISYFPFGDKLKYYRIEDFGKYKTFYFIKKVNFSLTLVGVLANMITPDKISLMVIDGDGNVKYPDHAFMRKILKNQEDLKKDFENEWLPFEKYDYATEEPEPDESIQAKKAIVRKYIILLNKREK